MCMWFELQACLEPSRWDTTTGSGGTGNHKSTASFYCEHPSIYLHSRPRLKHWGCNVVRNSPKSCLHSCRQHDEQLYIPKSEAVFHFGSQGHNQNFEVFTLQCRFRTD